MSVLLSADAKRFLCKHWAIAYLTIEEIRENTPEAIKAFRIFVGHLQKRFDIPDIDINREIEVRRNC